MYAKIFGGNRWSATKVTYTVIALYNIRITHGVSPGRYTILLFTFCHGFSQCYYLGDARLKTSVRKTFTAGRKVRVVLSVCIIDFHLERFSSVRNWIFRRKKKKKGPIRRSFVYDRIIIENIILHYILYYIFKHVCQSYWCRFER